MQIYEAPLSDIRFLLEVFDYDTLPALERFRDFDLETAMALAEEFSRYCVEVLAPLNEVGDRVGVKYDPEDHSVTLPDGFREAWAGYAENGFTALQFDPEYGGMGAPHSLATLMNEVLTACNKSFSMCVGLSEGLIDALMAHGSDEQKETWVTPLVSGTWGGTMCLTEPHCGTDLGLLTTRADPEGDHYRITGTKIWITFGEHDLTENIVHFVLARTPDAPPGTRGISVFVVPKFLADGSRNGVFCGGADHKMGIHASPTCIVNFEGAQGWLVGEVNRGMRSMFTMMNGARLKVGIEGVALGEAAYQAALAFARDRAQGRALDPQKRAQGQADNILVHPDVRRMLLNQKSTNEGMRGLVAWIGVQYDLSHHATDPAVRERATDLVALLTPIIKSYGSERGFANISEAMQVTGGAGYTTDWPIEQYLRDERIAMIYEGTNHIQALDLVARKLPMGGGRLLRVFAEEVGTLLEAHADDPELAPYVRALAAESKRLHDTTMALGAAAAQDAELVGAVANHYLNQFALVALGYVWLRQLGATQRRDASDALRRSKAQTGRYFFEVVLPEARAFAERVAVGKGPVVDIDVDLL